MMDALTRVDTNLFGFVSSIDVRAWMRAFVCACVRVFVNGRVCVSA